MFSRDPNHYRATPRSMQTSKFGPYSRLSGERRSRAGGIAYIVACLLCAAAIGLMLAVNG